MFPFADTNPTKRWEIVTYVLVAINVLAFLWFNGLRPDRQQEAVLKLGFIPARVQQLSDPQKVVEVPIDVPVQFPNGMVAMQRQMVRMPADPPQILASAITCMFMHGGWLHLIGNMWFLLLFGNNVEDRLGHGVYLAFYFLGGLIATVTHWAFDPTSTIPIVGASGAVAAVLGAYAVAFPHARIRSLVILIVVITVVELPAYVFLVLWFGIQLLEGLGALRIPLGGQTPGVAWWAHIGGFVAGAAMMFVLLQIVPPDPPDEKSDERRFEF